MTDRPIGLGRLVAARIDAFVGRVKPETPEERRARLERLWLRRRRQHEEIFGVSPRRARAAITAPAPSAPPSPAEIVAEVLRRLGPATRAEFITPGNAEAVTGQDFRWVKAEARRLGVPVGGSGKKRVVDVAAFRAALAAGAEVSSTNDGDADPVDALRSKLGYRLRKDCDA
ncbi:MAG: hypothetical protein IPM35_00105 [Myxococcales bacterium]|nr:hypothetical protein [Myxococcales bacterium]